MTHYTPQAGPRHQRPLSSFKKKTHNWKQWPLPHWIDILKSYSQLPDYNHGRSIQRLLAWRTHNPHHKRDRKDKRPKDAKGNHCSLKIDIAAIATLHWYSWTLAYSYPVMTIEDAYQGLLTQKTQDTLQAAQRHPRLPSLFKNIKTETFVTVNYEFCEPILRLPGFVDYNCMFLLHIW